jgi:hypothetical protein
MRAPVRRRSWSGWSLRELTAFLPLLPMFPAWIPSPNGNYSYSWMIASLRPDLAIRLSAPIAILVERAGDAQRVVS